MMNQFDMIAESVGGIATTPNFLLWLFGRRHSMMHGDVLVSGYYLFGEFYVTEITPPPCLSSFPPK